MPTGDDRCQAFPKRISAQSGARCICGEGDGAYILIWEPSPTRSARSYEFLLQSQSVNLADLLFLLTRYIEFERFCLIFEQ
jgi:hypothetical protein